MYYLTNYETEKKFDMLKYLDVINGNLDPLTSYIVTNLYKLPENGSYTIKNGEYRPDMLSYNLYGDTQYWWILLFYNNILHINQIKVGMNIVYPSLESIQNLYTQASTLQKTEGNS